MCEEIGDITLLPIERLIECAMVALAGRGRGGSGGMGCLHSNRNGYHYLYLLPISAQRLTVLAPSFGSHQTGHKSMPEWEMVARAGR